MEYADQSVAEGAQSLVMKIPGGAALVVVSDSPRLT